MLRAKHLITLVWIGFISDACQGQMAPAFDAMLNDLLSHSVNEIRIDEVREKKDAIYLDAREKKEFEVSHIKHAVWVGYNDFNKKRVAEIPKEKEVIVYCSVGYRSEKIAEGLKKLGFSKVYNLYGGIFEWVNEGNPAYNLDNKLTQQVHAYNEKWGVWLLKGEKVYE